MRLDGAWTLSSFLADAAITGGTQPTGRDECTDLRATSPCQYPDTDLCIECVGRTTADRCMP